MALMNIITKVEFLFLVLGLVHRTIATPTYISTYCPVSASLNSDLRSSLDDLLSNLSLAANSSSNPGFHSSTVGSPDVVAYGLYLCRGDCDHDTCKECVATAATHLSKNCSFSMLVAVSYDECMIWYTNSSYSLFGHMEDNYYVPRWNTNSIGGNVSQFNDLLWATLDAVAMEAAKGDGTLKFATKQAKFNEFITLYSLVQCTPDLSGKDCYMCLEKCISSLDGIITTMLGGSTQGGGIMYYSCNIRYEISPFYQKRQLIAHAPAPTPTASHSIMSQALNNTSPVAVAPLNHIRGANPRTKKITRRTIIITGSGLSALVLFFLGLTLLLRRINARSDSAAYLSDIVSVESLQMDFNIIRAATRNFAIDNKLGEGGFGPVYKGTLENGQNIAVKRLSENSGQGIVEFKTEVIVVAKLQHRNLVKLLGFCVSGKEKILVYEFLSNSSLDKILSDQTKRMSLNWETRFKIISGIAKGLMYLHEDSRQRVVHRDLKSSNILLDEAMHPKIADFGLAKLFGSDQTQAVTEAIAGTYGYMAPEYILMGQYSMKSDVYSFGIIVLEMVSGQRNIYRNRPLIEEALLYRTWKLWNEGEALKLVDEALGGIYAQENVIKCIHIGLLCIQESVAKRPNMTSIVAALGGQSITLPLPSPPNFFSETSTSSTIKTSVSGASSCQGVSINEISDITDLHVR